MVEAGPPPTRRAHIVPGFVGQPLHVVGQIPGEVDDRRSETGLRANAASGEPGFDEFGEHRRGDLVESHDRPGLVEGPTRSDHLVHQARFRAGKDVAHLSLLLCRRPQRMLDRAAVEALDRLELVQGDHHGSLSLRGEPPGQGEDLVRQPVDVALRPGRRKRDRETVWAPVLGFVADLRPRRRDGSGQPGSCGLPFRVGRGEGACIALEKRDVRTVAADRQIDRQRSVPRERGQRAAHEGRLAVSPR